MTHVLIFYFDVSCVSVLADIESSRLFLKKVKLLA